MFRSTFRKYIFIHYLYIGTFDKVHSQIFLQHSINNYWLYSYSRRVVQSHSEVKRKHSFHPFN